MGYVAAKFAIPGERGLSVVRAAVAAGEYVCQNPKEVDAANKAVGHSYLTRDKKRGNVFYPGARAEGLLAHLGARDGAETTAVAVAPSPAAMAVFDSSVLSQLVERARGLLDDGDVMRARMLAVVAYDQAKAAGHYAARFDAAEGLVAKARKLQADALLIETRAKMIVATEWDAATEAGQTNKGRPKSVSDGNTLTTEDTGLSRKELHEARKLAAAEAREPGLVEQAIAARLRAGLEPTRANLRHTIGTKSATNEDRGNNLYETPAEGTWSILAMEQFTPVVDEPFCGRGAIVRVLEASGYDVAPSDLVDYGTVTKDGECQAVRDFLTTEAGSGNDIVSNPPYGEYMNACIAHALRVHRPRKMALLLNLGAQAGFEDPDRNFIFEDCPPARIYVNKRRLPMMHRDGWDGKKASSQMHTMWCVWELQDDGTYGDQTFWMRVDYASEEVERYRAAHEAESEAA